MGQRFLAAGDAVQMLGFVIRAPAAPGVGMVGAALDAGLAAALVGYAHIGSQVLAVSRPDGAHPVDLAAHGALDPEESFLALEAPQGASFGLVEVDGAPAALMWRRAGPRRLLRLGRDGLLLLVGRTVLVRWLRRVAVDGVARRIEDASGTRERLRTFGPDDWSLDEALPPDAVYDAHSDWTHLLAGRGLLVLHGTGRQTHEGFGQRAPDDGSREAARDQLGALHALYQGRLMSWDHRVLSQSVRENAQRLLDCIPAGQRWEVDLLTQSRGGLVARFLSEAWGRAQLDGAEKLSVRRIVFATAANRGTPLANVFTLRAIVDHALVAPELFARLLGVFPLQAVLGLLHALVDSLAAVAAAFPGLVDLAPGSLVLKGLNGAPEGPAGARYHAIAARLQADGALGEAAVRLWEDLAFQEANDLIVPTAGVADPGVSWGQEHFPIARRRELPAGAHHLNVFHRPDAWGWTREWLSAG